ncbi:TetR/AcrR family transcriptional regulator [Companilactobacillus alimentarius]|uniref:TetR/AcrR family transcriptional regulator n=1 Tax=Companilactobacillus alimentarius TaxID=1602 RepID=UPI0028BC9C2C|nr:TetR/AcrR family transcriptional regulator [Companilactobacillus alimentarius]MDT6953457.1 TetR/AcrR family transcriptional regulator [Companilactobacillus alimentarius]
MASQKERQEKTETNIIQALLEVGQTKLLAQISVSDITRVSHINRGTFYLHFLDKNDLVNQVTKGFIEQVQMILRTEMSESMDYRYFSEDKPYPVIKNLVDLVAENKELVRFMLGINGDPEFYPTITAELKTAILNDLKRVKGNQDFTSSIPNEYAIRLITSMILTIIKTWIDGDDGLTKEAVSKIIMKGLYLSPYQMLGIGKSRK